MDSTEFSERVRALRGPLWRVAYAILRGGADCDDALQEALFRAWRGVDGLKNPAFFSTWLTRILINECYRIARNPARKAAALAREARDEAHDDHSNLRDAIFALPSSLRLPLVLHYMEGYSIREVASMLALPATTVAWRLRAAKSKLRKEL